ncbi:hypothetical protein GM182_02250 [bacterium 3DAC]|nr:hypothetical protein GM182_02250 [bacterium 3DAC]
MRRTRRDNTRKKVDRTKNAVERTVILDEHDKKNHVSRKGSWLRYLFTVFIGAMVVVAILLFLTYKSMTVLFPWIFGNHSDTKTDVIQKTYLNIAIPVFQEGKITYEKKKIADAGEEFTISYVYSQFSEHNGFTLGYDTKNKLRIISVEKGTSGWEVYLSGSGIPFYTSWRIRQQICQALDNIEQNINEHVILYYDGMNIRKFIPCDAKDGYMVFYVRGSSVRARWIYDEAINKSDLTSYFMTVLKMASQLGDTDFIDMVTSVSFENNVLTVKVKKGSFAGADPYVRYALIYNMMYLYPYISTIRVEDEKALPYVDTRLDPILLVPTTGDDFLARMGDRLSFTKQLSDTFPVINSVKIGNGKAVIDLKYIPSREITQAILRSTISAKEVTSVILTIGGKSVPFWADPFEEDF